MGHEQCCWRKGREQDFVSDLHIGRRGSWYGDGDMWCGVAVSSCSANVWCKGSGVSSQYSGVKGWCVVMGCGYFFPDIGVSWWCGVAVRCGVSNHRIFLKGCLCGVAGGVVRRYGVGSRRFRKDMSRLGSVISSVTSFGQVYLRRFAVDSDGMFACIVIV